jgi:hypothetical protein
MDEKKKTDGQTVDNTQDSVPSCCSQAPGENKEAGPSCCGSGFKSGRFWYFGVLAVAAGIALVAILG